MNTIDPPSIFSQVPRELGVLQRQGTHSQSQETTSAHDCRHASCEYFLAVQGSSSRSDSARSPFQYKEGLEGVIVPTVDSLKEAIMTYERQGGTASILVCDDGMQLWDEENANIRKAYYDSREIVRYSFQQSSGLS